MVAFDCSSFCWGRDGMQWMSSWGNCSPFAVRGKFGVWIGRRPHRISLWKLQFVCITWRGKPTSRRGQGSADCGFDIAGAASGDQISPRFGGNGSRKTRPSDSAVPPLHHAERSRRRARPTTPAATSRGHTIQLLRVEINSAPTHPGDRRRPTWIRQSRVRPVSFQVRHRSLTSSCGSTPLHMTRVLPESQRRVILAWQIPILTAVDHATRVLRSQAQQNCNFRPVLGH